jgi:hypothetical protein
VSAAGPEAIEKARVIKTTTPAAARASNFPRLFLIFFKNARFVDKL